MPRRTKSKMATHDERNAEMRFARRKYTNDPRSNMYRRGPEDSFLDGYYDGIKQALTETEAERLIRNHGGMDPNQS
jgi:hypothetical protein